METAATNIMNAKSKPSNPGDQEKKLIWSKGSRYHIETVPKRFTIAAYYSLRTKDYIAWDCMTADKWQIGIVTCVSLTDEMAQRAAIDQLKQACEDWSKK